MARHSRVDAATPKFQTGRVLHFLHNQQPGPSGFRSISVTLNLGLVKARRLYLAFLLEDSATFIYRARCPTNHIDLLGVTPELAKQRHNSSCVARYIVLNMPPTGQKRKRKADDEGETLQRQILPVANLPSTFDGEPEDGLQYLWTVRCVVLCLRIPTLC